MSGEDTKEILIHLEYLKAGVDAIGDRLDTLNGRTRKVEQDVAVLHDRADQSVAATAANKATAIKWGAGVGAALSALVAGLSQAFGAK